MAKARAQSTQQSAIAPSEDLAPSSTSAPRPRAKAPQPPRRPHLEHEAELWGQGYRRIAGIDEAGRGALAGPVVAAAVILPDSVYAGATAGSVPGIWGEMRDSKLLAPGRRATLAAAIRAHAIAAVGMASAQEIDALGIAVATRLAMMRAVEGLAECADSLLIDWVRLTRCPLPQRSFAKADQISVSVAAASILAKVTRDAYMCELDTRYAAYGFARHKGYGARAHLTALEACGPCVEHRFSFAPLAARATLFDELQAARGASEDVGRD